MKHRWWLVLALVLAMILQTPWGFSQQALPSEIVIGGPISLSGTYAKEGQQGNWGFLVAEKWVNEVYGGVRIGGKRIPIRYKYYDDESKKETVTSLLERLITADRVKFLLAPYSSGLTLAGAPVAEKYKALYNSHGGASDRIFEQGYKYAVQTIGIGSRYQLSAADLVVALDPKATRVALLFEDDEFSRTVLQGIKQYITTTYAAKPGLQVVFERTYPSAVRDLTPALTEMKTKAPDVVIGGGHFADGQLLARQMSDLGMDVKAASIVVAPLLPAFAEALGKYANGFMGPSHWEIGARFSPETLTEGAPKTITLASSHSEPIPTPAPGGVYVKVLEGEVDIEVIDADRRVDPATAPAERRSAGQSYQWVIQSRCAVCKNDAAIRVTTVRAPARVELRWLRLAYIGPAQAEFIAEFAKLSKGVPAEYHAADAIAAILAYVKAIERAQSLDVDKVRAAMNELWFVPFYGEWGIDPATGKQVRHKMVLAQWQYGKKEIVWPPEAQTAKPCYPMALCGR